LLFSAFDPEHARELWTTNGTPAGTFKITPEPLHNLRSYVSVGDLFYYIDHDCELSRWDLWRTDGTVAGTVLLRTTTGEEEMKSLCALGEAAAFVNTLNRQDELWTSDGTVAGTTRLFEMPFPNANNESLVQLWSAGDLIYFCTTFTVSSPFPMPTMHQVRGPWRSDGTLPGTFRLSGDVVGNYCFFPPVEVCDTQGGVYVQMGRYLMHTDGTIAGTTICTSHLPVDEIPTSPISPVVSAGGREYLLAEENDVTTL